ncbi:MAG: PD40 domain-containing protein, partial [Bdellovibrionaceae bacterium]|nr:PD40 domain-containing protein [Bdellovibrio sp.]
MSRWFTLLLILASTACSTSPKAPKEILSSKTLQEIEVTQRPEAPKFAFEEFYKTSGLTNFDFSPDGKTIFFLKSDGKVRNIFKFDVSSKKISQVTKYSEAINSFKVGPQGQYLYIQKDIGGSEVFDLYQFDLKKSQSKQLTFGKDGERSYLCDIDKTGSRLYFSQSRNQRAAYDIKYVDLKTLKTSVLVNAGDKQLYCDALNASGDKILF